jgi:hypothetical protein
MALQAKPNLSLLLFEKDGIRSPHDIDKKFEHK